MTSAQLVVPLLGTVVKCFSLLLRSSVVFKHLLWCGSTCGSSIDGGKLWRDLLKKQQRIL